jgi:glutathione synthase/RimK-type ligase-like ATP-grasp enzyme
LASCAALPELNDEGNILRAALGRVGVDAVPAVWNAPVNWDAFDAVIIRTTEDYFRDATRFLDWAEMLGERLFNSPEIVRWNHDKSYLAELATAGISVVSTRYVRPGQDYRFPETNRFVVKPAVSAGANSTAVYSSADRERAHEHVGLLHEAGRTVMLQPYYRQIEVDAETAVIFIDGQLSHCMRKEPVVRQGDLPTDSRGETMSIRTPVADMLELAWRAHDLVAQRFGVPLYARVDAVRDDLGEPAVMELELIEPLLFLDFVPAAADRLALAFLAKMKTREIPVPPSRSHGRS